MNQKPFDRLTSRVVPLVRDDIDTDQIIPARFLTTTVRTGLGDHLFADWRTGKDGAPDPTFPLALPEHRGAAILLAGDNFGCGSSREHAPWALADFGFRVIIARSFADIFRGNAAKNGLLTVALDEAAHRRLVDLLSVNPRGEVTVNLVAETVTLPDGTVASFSIDPFARHCLLQGTDELGYLLSFEQRIAEHEARVARRGES